MYTFAATGNSLRYPVSVHFESIVVFAWMKRSSKFRNSGACKFVYSSESKSKVFT